MNYISYATPLCTYNRLLCDGKCEHEKGDIKVQQLCNSLLFSEPFSYFLKLIFLMRQLPFFFLFLRTSTLLFLYFFKQKLYLKPFFFVWYKTSQFSSLFDNLEATTFMIATAVQIKKKMPFRRLIVMEK